MILSKWRASIFRKPWALEWALRIWGGKKILADYFLSRCLTIGVSYPDALSVFTKIKSRDDWVLCWYKLGIRCEYLAKKAESDKLQPTATHFWMMARAAYHVAQFPFFENLEMKSRIYKRCVDAYGRAAPHLHPPARKVEIPFRNTNLPGYLRLSSNPESQDILVIFGGIDGVKEEIHYYGEYFVSRGFSVLYFDAPGIGESWERLKMDPDYVGLGQALYHFLESAGEKKFSKINLMGISLGGNIAIHIAASSVPIHRCIAICAPMHPSRYFKKLLFLIQQAAYHVIGSPEFLDNFMERISLKGVVERVDCPILIIGGGRDAIIPGSEALAIYEMASEPKKLLYYKDATHCCPERTSEMFYEIEKWLKGSGS